MAAIRRASAITRRDTICGTSSGSFEDAMDRVDTAKPIDFGNNLSRSQVGPLSRSRIAEKQAARRSQRQNHKDEDRECTVM